MRIVFFAMVIFFTSCLAIAKHKYQLGRSFTFTSKNLYKKYLTDKRKFPEGQLVYLERDSYFNFINDAMMKEGSTAYLGTFLNDSVAFKKSVFLDDNQACIGRIKNEIVQDLSMQEIPDSNLEKNINLGKYSFRYFNDNSPAFPGKVTKTATIILLYNYAFGSYYDNLYKEIIELENKSSYRIELFIVATDNVGGLTQ